MLKGQPSVVVIGAVRSTFQILQGLLRNEVKVAGVFTLDPAAGANVSGLASGEIAAFCADRALPHWHFTQVNHAATVEAVRRLAPDLVFAVGFSQLVGAELLAIPKLGTVGFHPTQLPHGRGRAPLAWLTYLKEDGAATFFLMGEGADDGPILVQEPFQVAPDDHAEEVAAKGHDAIDRALDRWLPRLRKGEWNPIQQSELEASYTGIRYPGDGLIQWQAPVDHSYGLIRAASHPHPGAYTYLKDRKLIIWRAEKETEARWRGVPGRVLQLSPRGALVQAGEGQLWLRELEYPDAPGEAPALRVGVKLGYSPEDEIHKLKHTLADLQAALDALQNLARSGR